MERQHDDYLGHLAFRQGEHERLEQAFEGQVEQLARLLEAAIGARLRAQARGNGSLQWSTAIRNSAEGLRKSFPAAGANQSSTLSYLRRLLPHAPADDGWPCLVELEPVARARSRETCQLILARWFEVVHHSLDNQESVALTPNALPDGMTFHQMLREVELAKHGIDELVMSSCWRGHWKLQSRHFRQQREPIELASNLFLVAERPGFVEAYRVFSNLESAKSSAAAQLHAMSAA